MSAYHTPVLLHESIAALLIRENGVYVDATFGGGGHSREILRHLGPEGRLIVFDKDEEALANVPEDGRLIVVHHDFRFVHHYVRYYGHDAVDGILADLGVSSHQFDTAERGFSFRFDAPLDMRMNTQGGKTAADVVNTYTQEELETLFRTYGEVDGARALAKSIVAAREKAPVLTTADLGSAIADALPSFQVHKQLPKIYQALRIEVNAEMRSLEKFLQGAAKALKPGGRLVVITYHSLEDRMVKQFIRERENGLEAVNRKPILPGEEEIIANPRARSAKLRIAQKSEKLWEN